MASYVKKKQEILISSMGQAVKIYAEKIKKKKAINPRLNKK